MTGSRLHIILFALTVCSLPLPGCQGSHERQDRTRGTTGATQGDPESTGGAAAGASVPADTSGTSTIPIRVDSAQTPIPAPAELRPAEPPLVDSDTAASPAIKVIRLYYKAIADHDYRTAYRLWENNGQGSGQRFTEFRQGYWQTDSVDVTIGTPGRIEGAAGSRYIAIPVTLRATMHDGSIQIYQGDYTLRRSVVPGATRDQQAWRIYSAAMKLRSEKSP